MIHWGDALDGWLQSFGMSSFWSFLLAQMLMALAVVLIAALFNWVTKRILLASVHQVIRRTRTEWDDVLIEKDFFSRLAHLAPAIVIYISARLFPDLQSVITNVALAYMGLIGLLVAGAVLDSAVAIYRTFPVSRTRPIRGYIQAVKVFIYVVGGIALIGTLIDESPWKLLSGIGAMTAILLLVFKDSILGIVASIQIAANDMVRIGDWIEMAQYGADGDVIDVSIQCVKVRNFDKTITTIPTYALVSESFRNWRGMQESGGRRIKRCIYIDTTSIRFVTPKLLEKFRRFAFIQEYLDEKLREVEEFNRQHGFDLSNRVNGRRLTNIGTFRAYIREYLRRHPRIAPNMTLLVRHQPPTEHGLPIEIYAFANDIRWPEYESIQADIFDHILAVVPEFELRVFQNPSGLDLRDALAAGEGLNRAEVSGSTEDPAH